MNKLFCYINNEFLLAENAALSITDLALQRGYGIFDFLRIVQNVPLFLVDHLYRFFQSAEEMHLPVGQTAEELEVILLSLIEKNNIPNSGLRITLTGGYSDDGYKLGNPNLIITQQPLPMPSTDTFEKGIRLVTYDHQRQLPHVKTIDYLMAIWLQPFIKQHGADDVLYYKNGVVSECPRANVFIVTEDSKIITPKEGILKGITRGKIIQLARHHFLLQERVVFLNDLKNAREIFITSSTKKVLPVTQVDTIVFNNGKPGKITIEISNLFQTLEAEHLLSAIKKETTS